MAKPVSNLRLFAAVYPPTHLAKQWIDALSSLDLPAHRVVPIEQIHLTLQFIGDTPAKATDDVIESVERATGGLGSFSLNAQRLIPLPERGRARLIAVETDGPATLLELQRRLALRLARNVRAKPGQKYRPHITLCRFRSPGHFKMVETQIDDEPFLVERIVLMRSALRAEGAEHHEVAAFPLNQC